MTNQSGTIKKEQFYAHPIDSVWKAITENESVSKWLVPTNFRGEVGFHFTLQDPKRECNVVQGVVKEASPYTLVYSWIDENHTDIETTVSWYLTTKDGGTIATMIHTGISNYEDKIALAQLDNFGKGWKRCFDQLEVVLNSK